MFWYVKLKLVTVVKVYRKSDDTFMKGMYLGTNISLQYFLDVVKCF